MNKKSVSATILVLFLALVFAVIGACFTAFVYQDKKIEFKEVKVVASSGIEVFEDDKLTSKIDKLKLSEMKLGLKPATGEIDAETKIPSTITDERTSEGYYETIYVKTSSSFKVIVKDIKIENKKDQQKAELERENIFVAIKDVKDSAKSFKQEEVEVATFSDVSNYQKIIIMFWLGPLSGEDLVGSKISFTLEFRSV